LRTLVLGDTGIETSELGFGCADLFREPSRARRQRLLAAALDAGICHFDVAPMYGLGLVEGELGRFAQGQRDRIVIATKFGIEPAPAARILAPAQPAIDRFLRATPAVGARARPRGADPRAGTVGRLLYRSRGYDAGAARAGLERSLRALRTDHLDLLFLHEPAPADIRSDEVAGYLDSARASGELRAWGIAGEPERAVAAARRLGARVPVLQVPGGLLAPPLRRVPGLAVGATILFGAVGRALPRVLAHVRSDARVLKRWSDAVGVDCGEAEAVASLLLSGALEGNPGGPVLFGTVDPARIESAARTASARVLADPSLDAFKTLVEAELLGAGEAS
jgi:D-threo-aldose 1-dehydrogenase